MLFQQIDSDTDNINVIVFPEKRIVRLKKKKKCNVNANAERNHKTAKISCYKNFLPHKVDGISKMADIFS